MAQGFKWYYWTIGYPIPSLLHHISLENDTVQCAGAQISLTFYFLVSMKGLDKSISDCISVAFHQCKWHYVVLSYSNLHKVLQLWGGGSHSVLTQSFSTFLGKETRLPIDNSWNNGFWNMNRDSPRTRMRTLSYCIKIV